MTAATKAAELTIDAPLIEELTAVERVFSDATTRLEELHRDGRFKDPTAPRTRELSWLIQGFTDDLLLDVEEIAKHALALRDFAMGGLNPKELELLHAVGGEH